MKLYFIDAAKKERLISECDSIQVVSKEISKFLSECDYKSYYTRIWYEPIGSMNAFKLRTEGRFIYDVGSHCEFFELYVSDEEMKNLPENMYNMTKDR